MEQLIIRQCLRENKALPEKIQNAPELFLGLDLYYTAFLDLNSCRAIGYGEEGPIPWTAISIYCERKRFDSETTYDMFYLIRAMDNNYLKWKAEKTKRELANKNSNRKH